MMSDHKNGRLTFREIDEGDKPTATYIFSEQNAPSPGLIPGGRVDVIPDSPSSSSWSTKPLVATLGDIFLPSGYPQSVSDDYLPYQVFDSLQAFCSSIAGLLSSRAVLQGVGVGNADASPTSALLLHILQDTSGRLATIFFAHRVGTALEPECKTYRLAADVFNDIAMVLDCLSPMVPAGVMRVTVLSTAGVLRALCGVAGGSSKASLSAHFARWGNLAELNAKDSSQETVISLFGMLVGSVVISHISGFKTTWIALIILLTTHLAMNYKAVRAVQMTSINRQRANIIFSTILSQEYENNTTHTQSLKSNAQPQSKSKLQESPLTIPSPAQVAYQERIFHTANALQWIPVTSKPVKRAKLGTAEIGISLPTFLQNAGGSKKTSNSYQILVPIRELHTLFTEEEYMLFLSPRGRSTSRQWHASILLKKGCRIQSQLKAWAHALLAAHVLSETDIKIDVGAKHGSVEESVLEVVKSTLGFLNGGARMERYLEALVAEGWEVDIAALETKGGRRIVCD